MKTLGMCVLSALAACGGTSDPFDAELATDESAATMPSVGINEFTAGPSGWIELYNRTTRTKDVGGWAVDDTTGGSAPKVLPTGSRVPAKGFLVVTYASINVGSADEVRLLDKAGKVIDSVGNFWAGRSIARQCYGRFPDGADWAGAALGSCTQGAANVGAPATSTGTCAAGTFGGVAFTKTEACRAIAFVNTAPYSKLSGLGLADARIAFDCRADGTCGARSGTWRNLDELQQFGHGARCSFTAFTSLKSLATAWNGDTTPDSIASTFAARTALSGSDVAIARAYVSEALPTQRVEQRGCVVARDTPGGAAWMTVCDYVNPFADDVSPGYTGLVGKWISIRGQVTYDRYLAGGARWAIEERAPSVALQCGSGLNGFQLAQ